MDWLQRTWRNIVSVFFALLVGAGGMYIWQQGQFDQLENKFELLARQQRIEISDQFTALNNRFTAMDTQTSGQMNGVQSSQNELLVVSGMMKTELANIKDQLGRVVKRLEVVSLDTPVPTSREPRTIGSMGGSAGGSEPKPTGQREPAVNQ